MRRFRYGGAARAAAWAAPILLAAVSAASEVSALRLEHTSSLLRQGRLVVAGHFGEVESLDHGRLRVAPFVWEEVFKGARPQGGISVVELRDFPSSPPAFRPGLRGVLFLAPLAWNSYLRGKLPPEPPGGYWQLVSGRHGALLADTPAAAAQITEAIREAVRLLGGSTVPSAAEQRALIRALLLAPVPRLVEDGARSLAAAARLPGGLTPELRQAAATALRREDLPGKVKRELIAAMAELGDPGLKEVLRTVDDPDLAYDVWKALERLGQAPSVDELQAALNDPQAERRIAAVRLLRERQGDDAIPVIANAALHDPEERVRIAAIEQLGATRSVLALRPLERIFADPTPAIRQATARAILAIGGRPAQETLARLAMEGPADGQRYATALLMLSGVKRDDPLLERIRKTHPNREVRDLAEHGVQLHH